MVFPNLWIRIRINWNTCLRFGHLQAIIDFIKSLLSINNLEYMNFSFDFHQFLLLFIDVFKTLESVTTLSSYFKANKHEIWELYERLLYLDKLLHLELQVLSDLEFKTKLEFVRIYFGSSMYDKIFKVRWLRIMVNSFRKIFWSKYKRFKMAIIHYTYHLIYSQSPSK